MSSKLKCCSVFLESCLAQIDNCPNFHENAGVSPWSWKRSSGESTRTASLADVLFHKEESGIESGIICLQVGLGYPPLLIRRTQKF